MMESIRLPARHVRLSFLHTVFSGIAEYRYIPEAEIPHAVSKQVSWERSVVRKPYVGSTKL